MIHRRDECTPGNIAHMGMVICQNKLVDIQPAEMDCKTLNFSTKKMQFSKLNIFKKISVLFVYVNKTPGISETKEIGETLKKENATVILGDLNINTDEEDGRRKVKDLCRILEMKQVNKESTRNRSTLDLIFRKEMKELDFMPFVFQNMYSDHSAVGFRYCEDGIISADYKESHITNQDKDFLAKTTIDSMAEQERSWRAEQERDEKVKEEKINSKSKRSKKPKNNTPNTEYEADVIVMNCPIDVARLSNIRKLLSGDWVDSHVINCYFYLISREFSHIFTTSTWFNEQLKSRDFKMIDRQFKNINIFEYGLWMIPINCNNRHWFLLAVDTTCLGENKISISIYDSLGDLKTWGKVLEDKQLTLFIHWKYVQSYNVRESPLEIGINDMNNHIPQQGNGVDCGVFTIMFGKYLANGHQLTFKQEDMVKFRKNIYQEIRQGKLEDIIWDSYEDFELPENFTDTEKEDEEELEIPGTGSRRVGRPTQENLNMRIHRFVNPGGNNLCFSNAVVSVILNLQGIQDILRGNFPRLNQNSIFSELKRLSTLPSNQTSSTKKLRRMVQEQCLRNQQNARNFDSNAQFDAAEFFGSLLEHMLYDHSDIVNNLFGRNQETIFCMNPECNTADQIPSNVINIVVLPLVGPTLLMCLNEYLTEHVIQRNCPHCHSNSASQITAFTLDPEIIIFQLNRFIYSEEHQTIRKMHDQIEVPTRITLPNNASYEIVGAIFHSGPSTNSGHYTAAIFCKEKNSFYFCNDEHISEIESFDEDHKSEVYLIIYERN